MRPRSLANMSIGQASLGVQGWQSKKHFLNSVSPRFLNRKSVQPHRAGLRWRNKPLSDFCGSLVSPASSDHIQRLPRNLFNSGIRRERLCGSVSSYYSKDRRHVIVNDSQIQERHKTLCEQRSQQPPRLEGGLCCTNRSWEPAPR